MIYLIDSSIYIFRAWQSLPGSLRNTFGEQANAVFGYADTLAHIIQSEKPTYFVCTFDHSSKVGIRYQLYPEYKANRTPAPPELEIQFKRCLQTAEAMGLPCFGSKKVEADDIIGSFAQVAHRAQQNVTIISADKDLAQFIGEHDIYWNLAQRKRSTYNDLIKRFKLRPDQMADMLALAGDKVDNIPGIPGVGQTTAARLLRKWQTLDNLLANCDKVAMMRFRGAQHVALQLYEHKSVLALSRQLTGLIIDDDLPNNMNAFERKYLDSQRIIENLMAIGFCEQRSTRLASQLDDQTTTSHSQRDTL